MPAEHRARLYAYRSTDPTVNRGHGHYAEAVAAAAEAVVKGGRPCSA